MSRTHRDVRLFSLKDKVEIARLVQEEEEKVDIKKDSENEKNEQ